MDPSLSLWISENNFACLRLAAVWPRETRPFIPFCLPPP